MLIATVILYLSNSFIEQTVLCFVVSNYFLTYWYVDVLSSFFFFSHSPDLYSACMHAEVVRT